MFTLVQQEQQARTMAPRLSNAIAVLFVLLAAGRMMDAYYSEKYKPYDIEQKRGTKILAGEHPPISDNVVASREQSLPTDRDFHVLTKRPIKDEGFHVLPKRLITVFGLESSGTKFLMRTLAKAAEANEEPGFGSLTSRNYDTQTEIQHVSLPWGMPYKRTESIPDIHFVPPLECSVWPYYHKDGHVPISRHTPPDKHCYNETGLRKRVLMPQRFMVNITSHVKWYRDRGVNATAVILVRDDYTHFHGKLRYKRNQQSAAYEDFHAKEFIADAMRQLNSIELVMVSYEMLMSLQTPYLQDLYKRLGMRSSYVPVFQNGNKKYIVPPKAPRGRAVAKWRVDPGQRAPDR